MRRTTASPVFDGSPTRVATWTPFGNAGLSFQITVSGVTWVCLSCARPEFTKASKAATAKNGFLILFSPENKRLRRGVYQGHSSCLFKRGHFQIQTGPVVRKSDHRTDV